MKHRRADSRPASSDRNDPGLTYIPGQLLAQFRVYTKASDGGVVDERLERSHLQLLSPPRSQLQIPLSRLVILLLIPLPQMVVAQRGNCW